MSLEHFQNNMKDINLKQTIQEIYNEISLREKEVDSLNLRRIKIVPRSKVLFNHKF